MELREQLDEQLHARKSKLEPLAKFVAGQSARVFVEQPGEVIDGFARATRFVGDAVFQRPPSFAATPIGVKGSVSRNLIQSAVSMMTW